MTILTFTGGPNPPHNSSDWNDPMNWDPHLVPMDGDSVIIGNDPPDSPAVFDPAIYTGGTINLQDLTVGQKGLVPGGDGALMSVRGSFRWPGGIISDGGTIRIEGQGFITGGPPGPFLGGPNLNNNCVLDVTGTLTITGPGSLTIGAGQGILNSGTITLDQSGLYWDGGSPPLIRNSGTITTLGTVTLEGGDVTNLGTVNISAGSELLLKGGAVFRLAGGQVTGTGTLHPADDGGDTGIGAVSVEAATVLPAGLALNLSGFGQVTTPLPQQANPPILTIDGTLNLNGGTLYSLHTVLSQKGQCTISGTTSNVDGGKLDNRGVITLLPNAVWNLDDGAQINNTGRISLQGGSSLSVPAGFANLANGGLIDSRGATPNQISSLRISNTGNIAVRERILNLVSDASLTVTGGSVSLYDTTLDSSDGSGSLIMSGGASGGVLLGTGIVGARVINSGSVEPGAAGLILRGGYTQENDGSLVLPLTAWNNGSQPPITVTGRAALSGSLFITG